MDTRIGVLGGTFNPVHIGHLIMAQDALESFNLAGLLFVPCNLPPHKPVSPALASTEARLRMLQIATDGDVRIDISDIETQRPGISYTIDTIHALRRESPGTEFMFVIGSDSLTELHGWKDIDVLLKFCRFGVIPRPGFTVESEVRERIQLPPPWPERLLQNIAAGHAVNVSSRDIRHRIAEGMSIRYLVHPGVEMYITEHSLYR